MMRLSLALGAGLVLLVGSTLSSPLRADTVPSGWQRVRDFSGQCEISVPANWQVTRGSLVQISGGGSKYHIGLPPVLRSVKKDFNGERAKIKHAWESDHSFSTLEETDSRTIYRFQNAMHLYQFEVLVPGATSPCQAYLTVDQKDDSLVLQIARTLHRAN